MNESDIPIMERQMAMRESQTYFSDRDDGRLDDTGGDDEENMDKYHNKIKKKT